MCCITFANDKPLIFGGNEANGYFALGRVIIKAGLHFPTSATGFFMTQQERTIQLFNELVKFGTITSYYINDGQPQFAHSAFEAPVMVRKGKHNIKAEYHKNGVEGSFSVESYDEKVYYKSLYKILNLIKAL